MTWVFSMAFTLGSSPDLAPAAMFFAIDRIMGADQWADVGMFMQSVMLLARERGLHTCPQEAWASWHRDRKSVV